VAGLDTAPGVDGRAATPAPGDEGRAAAPVPGDDGRAATPVPGREAPVDGAAGRDEGSCEGRAAALGERDADGSWLIEGLRLYPALGAREAPLYPPLGRLAPPL
jgi:hypothetical protein